MNAGFAVEARRRDGPDDLPSVACHVERVALDRDRRDGAAIDIAQKVREGHARQMGGAAFPRNGHGAGSSATTAAIHDRPGAKPLARKHLALPGGPFEPELRADRTRRGAHHDADDTC